MCVIYANPGMTEEQRELQQELKTLQTTPYSTSINTINRALMAGDRIANLKDGRKKTEISTDTTGSIVIKATTKDREEILTIGSEDEQPGEVIALLNSLQNTPIRKTLTLIMQTVNNELLDNGVFITENDRIEIPYKKLVELGLYKNNKTAKEGLLKAAQFLKRCNIEAYTIKNDGSKELLFDDVFVYSIKNTKNGRSAIIAINKYLDWTKLNFKYYSLPSFYYQLPLKAADLLQHIMIIAHQRTEEIQDKGEFTLSYDAIRASLLLPEPDAATNPTTQIRTPIEKAIGELADQTGRDKELQIIPDNKPARRIQDYLKRQLTIRIGGEYKPKIISYRKSQKEKTDRIKRKAENIKARIIAERELKNAENKGNT